MNDAGQRRKPDSSNFYVVVFGIIMLIGLVLLAWIGRPARSVMVGQQIPVFELQPLLNSNEAVATDQLEGKVTLLHFWGTWCPPCQKEFPEFVELAMEFEGEPDLKILSVSCSSGPENDLAELQNETTDFMSEYVASLPTYADPVAYARQQLAMLTPHGSFSYPTTVLVGKDGKIIEAMQGYLPGAMSELKSEIAEALAETNVSSGDEA